jgi:hypothetical protein
MNQSEHINELATALSKCQGEITPAIKDSKNPFFKSSYADLNSVWSVCREPLSKHGLAVIQTMDKDESGALVLVTTLAHSSGQWIRSRSPIPLLKQDPQSMGSSLTYMRRYSLSAIVGVSTDADDDGEAAMNRNGKEEKKPKEKKEESPVIDEAKRKELNKLADQCDPSYLSKVQKHLENLGMNGFDGIRDDIYLQVITGMKKNAELFQKE